MWPLASGNNLVPDVSIDLLMSISDQLGQVQTVVFHQEFQAALQPLKLTGIAAAYLIGL
jgi:hypothetical protein